MNNLMSILFFAVIIIVAILIIGLILSTLYKKASKEVAFVRTGFGGERVIKDGGAIILPVLHGLIEVNMNTMKLEVRRTADQALITKDRMRVDVTANFYVRVQPTAESIANAAQTLGLKTMEPELLKELVEGKFVDALRAVAAEMAMEELHEKRVDFAQKVQNTVSEELFKNGLELETVSLTGLDQTNKEYFNPENVFDAEGLTKMTEDIEARRKKRNDIEQDTSVEIARKNLQAERQQADIRRDTEFVRLETEKLVAIESEDQKRAIETSRAERETEIEAARATARKQTREAQITADQAVAIAQQDSEIAVAKKSEDKSRADAQASEARALAVKAEEEVVTARDTEVATRVKAVQLIEAEQEAQTRSIGLIIAAEAEKEAAENQAEAARLQAEGHAQAIKIEAQGQAEAEKLRASAAEETYRVDAEGKLKLNEAANKLSPEQIRMTIKLELIKNLSEIIEMSVKPMEKIDGIKVVHAPGLLGGSGVAGASPATAGSGSFADEIVNAALRYRGQSPLVDSILKEVGLDGSTLSGLVQPAVVEALADEEQEEKPTAQAKANTAPPPKKASKVPPAKPDTGETAEDNA